jgi:hypothetical protein
VSIDIEERNALISHPDGAARTGENLFQLGHLNKLTHCRSLLNVAEHQQLGFTTEGSEVGAASTVNDFKVVTDSLIVCSFCPSRFLPHAGQEPP